MARKNKKRNKSTTPKKVVVTETVETFEEVVEETIEPVVNPLDNLKGLVQVKFANDDSIGTGQFKDVLVASNGIYEKGKGSWAGTYVEKISDKAYGFSALPELEESISLSSDFPVIKREDILRVFAYYVHVTQTTGDEAQANFYYNEKGLDALLVDSERVPLNDIECLYDLGDNIIMYVPLQYNHKTETSVAKEDLYYDLLREQMVPYVETHSHNTMGAFSSGTDDRNSQGEGLQLVFGKMNLPTADFYSWATVGNVREDKLDNEEIRKFVDVPDTWETTDLPEFPLEWVDRAIERKYVTPKVSYVAGGKRKRKTVNYGYSQTTYTDDYEYDYGYDYEYGYGTTRKVTYDTPTYGQPTLDIVAKDGYTRFIGTVATRIDQVPEEFREHGLDAWNSLPINLRVDDDYLERLSLSSPNGYNLIVLVIGYHLALYGGIDYGKDFVF